MERMHQPILARQSLDGPGVCVCVCHTFANTQSVIVRGQVWVTGYVMVGAAVLRSWPRAALRLSAESDASPHTSHAASMLESGVASFTPSMLCVDAGVFDWRLLEASSVEAARELLLARIHCTT